ncbi:MULTISPECIES: PLP-dependent aminotransferase family protein [unclassified Actinomyces]|uniref:aminotransferase-like domain-containing protein n=1 Tax=unclassified Actinomyces TaxID=2609248 RepID=UPI002016F608|nr:MULTISPECIES: PLP-dependent aminotransferase family protein [unclassified Actinomyces]MCL3778556.1 PLP-dependent aminotransferase family protein [Actinomyces sp. AC-20-1]MCL3789509.1 PLP-dependent aminotransferase family protein [Actinomyces sp. 187325]MCL3791838.1 PLP-dependent aminotransferase family protein [Actinomyces sp. 186855]MCL3793517.1 PLP-dependent aminotransferase family protein [Actinomyces sp. 217892]
MSDANQVKGNRLDPWLDSYAARAHGLRASETRSLFAVAARPEVVSLAGGMPNLKDLPLDALAEATAQMIRKDGGRALQYGNGQGLPALREKIPEIMALEGIDADPEDVIITTGSQQAVDIITELFIDPGDVILAEAPTYVGSLSIFATYQADIQQVTIDADGVVPEALEEKIVQLEREGRNIKFFYCLPNFHNPAGVTLSEERRPQVIDICRRHHILIVEDNPYGLLGFEGQTYTALKTLAPNDVVYLGSFSKIFAPGYRVGWAVAPAAVRDKMKLASEAAILCPSSVGQYSIAMYLDNFDWQQQIKDFRAMYRGRRDAIVSALDEFMPQCTWNVPDGGFYVWVGLPEGLDAKDMLPRAVTNLVAYVSGTAFYAGGRSGRDRMRLSFCYPEPVEIREGVRRLSEVVSRDLELRDIFGPTCSRPVEGIVAPAPDQI